MDMALKSSLLMPKLIPFLGLLSKSEGFSYLSGEGLNPLVPI
jgi:hypothetical protein